MLAPWGAINAALGLSAPIHDEAHYAELLVFVDECFERFGSDVLAGKRALNLRQTQALARRFDVS